MHSFYSYNAHRAAEGYVHVEVTESTGEEQSCVKFILEPQVNTNHIYTARAQ